MSKIFAPSSQMHLRNFIYTMIAWRDAEQIDVFTKQRRKAALETLEELKAAIAAGQFNNLPKE